MSDCNIFFFKSIIVIDIVVNNPTQMLGPVFCLFIITFEYFSQYIFSFSDLSVLFYIYGQTLYPLHCILSVSKTIENTQQTKIEMDVTESIFLW